MLSITHSLYAPVLQKEKAKKIESHNVTRGLFMIKLLLLAGPVACVLLPLRSLIPPSSFRSLHSFNAAAEIETSSRLSRVENEKKKKRKNNNNDRHHHHQHSPSSIFCVRLSIKMFPRAVVVHVNFIENHVYSSRTDCGKRIHF